MGTTHGEMVVPKLFPRNGPRGTYSHFWMSRATQERGQTGLTEADGATGQVSPLPLMKEQTLGSALPHPWCSNPNELVAPGPRTEVL